MGDARHLSTTTHANYVCSNGGSEMTRMQVLSRVKYTDKTVGGACLVPTSAKDVKTKKSAAKKSVAKKPPAKKTVKRTKYTRQYVPIWRLCAVECRPPAALYTVEVKSIRSPRILLLHAHLVRTAPSSSRSFIRAVPKARLMQMIPLPRSILDQPPAIFQDATGYGFRRATSSSSDVVFAFLLQHPLCGY